MKVGRPLAYDPEAVLEAAMQVFWRQGYEGTSLDDLLKTMNLSKSSLYQAFGSKRELFLRCIKRYHEHTMQEMQERLDRSETGIAFIVGTLSSVVEEINDVANPRGCLMTNTASEFAQSDKCIAGRVASGLDGYKSMFLQAVERGVHDGSVRTDVEPALLAGYLVTNMSGLRTMVKAGTDRATLEAMVEVIVNTVR